MSIDIKKYTNKSLGQFNSIPIKLIDYSSQLDSLYLATYFHKMRTKPVAAIRKSKHYEATLSAWQKKLTDVDTSDLAAVAKTLGFNVEVFNPLASSEPQTSFSGGGRSKRLAQLLKVKKGVYKPMKAGAIIDELGGRREGGAVTRRQAALTPAEKFIRILKDENSTLEDILACLDEKSDQIYIDAWNEVLNVVDRHTPDTLIMRRRKINLQVENGTAVIPDNLQKCELARNPDMEEESIVDGITYPKGWPECPISTTPVGSIVVDRVGREATTWKGEYYYTRDPSSGKILCYNIDSIDKHRQGKDSFRDPFLRKGVVMFERLRRDLKKSTNVSSRVQYALDLEIGLLKAVEEGDLGATIKLINVGANVNTSKYDETPLHKSASKGHLEIARALIEAGADVKAKEKTDGMTPLHGSAKNEHLEVVKYLIEKGADVNAKDKWGRTPIHWSAQKGNLEVVKYLIEKGADVNARVRGATPLVMSAQSNNLEVMKYLIEIGGADVNNRDDGPLHHSAKNGNLEAVKYLIEKGADMEAKTAYYDMTPLHWSAMYGRLEVAKYLIEKGANVNVTGASGETPLHKSISGFWDETNPEIALLLINKGADVNARISEDRDYGLAQEKKGMTPLHLCAIKRYDPRVNGRVERLGEEFSKVAQALITAGADVDPVNVHGWTPLHNSAYNGGLEVARVLIEKGADLNRHILQEGKIYDKDMEGMTPLHLSAVGNHSDISKLLIEGGADMHSNICHGPTPLQLKPSIAEYQRNVRRRIGGGVGINEDETLSEAIQVLFSQMEDLTLKQNLTNKLDQITTGDGFLSKMFGKRKESKAAAGP